MNKILNELKGIQNLKKAYSYDYEGYPQFWVIDKPKKMFVVNHFCFTTGVADWIEEKYIKEGRKPTPKSYQQNVAIDFKTLKEAEKFVLKELSGTNYQELI